MIEKPQFTDELLTCVDCGREFSFTAGEQDYFWSKELAAPKRCKPCRERRKITIMKERESYGKESR